jgi:hypothetical protein
VADGRGWSQVAATLDELAGVSQPLWSQADHAQNPLAAASTPI